MVLQLIQSAGAIILASLSYVVEWTAFPSRSQEETSKMYNRLYHDVQPKLQNLSIEKEENFLGPTEGYRQ